MRDDRRYPPVVFSWGETSYASPAEVMYTYIRDGRGKVQITFLFMWDNMYCSSGRSIAVDSFDATEQHGACYS